MNRASRWVMLIGVAAAAGCAKNSPLPTYPSMDAPAALRVLADRSRAIHSVSSEGTLELIRPDGQSVRFDAALVMRPPDRVRIRAWKFSQAIFDLTLTPDGLWLVAPRNDRSSEKLRSAGVSASEFAKVWSLFSGAFFDQPDVVAENRGDRLFVRRVRGGEPTMVCEVDRKTLTPIRYEIQDDKGVAQFSLALSEYELIGALVWPRRAEADGPSGRIVVELRDVEVNGELAPEAFTPPPRAERLP